MKFSSLLPKFIISLGFPFLAGVIGSYFTAPAIDSWYVDLIKPPLNPPKEVFAPAWTLLYVLMGLAVFLVWKARTETKEKEQKRKAGFALIIFGLHLIFNAGWSFIFFGMQNLAGAFIAIVILWFFIFYLIVLFYDISRKAAYLLIPYFLWVGYAGYLNLSIWLLNETCCFI